MNWYHMWRIIHCAFQNYFQPASWITQVFISYQTHKKNDVKNSWYNQGNINLVTYNRMFAIKAKKKSNFSWNIQLFEPKCSMNSCMVMYIGNPWISIRIAGTGGLACQNWTHLYNEALLPACAQWSLTTNNKNIASNKNLCNKTI